MPHTYHLTLPKGLITFRNGIYRGSHTEAVWSPANPKDLGGWQDGDTLIVTCSFNLNPEIPSPPPHTDYVGLCAGACNSTNTSEVNSLIRTARSLGFPNPGELVGNGISTSSSRSASAIFYKCTSKIGTFPLQPPSRGTLTNYVYQYEMLYNGQNTVASGTEVEVVFGYGDPMDSEEIS